MKTHNLPVSSEIPSLLTQFEQKAIPAGEDEEGANKEYKGGNNWERQLCQQSPVLSTLDSLRRTEEGTKSWIMIKINIEQQQQGQNVP